MSPRGGSFPAGRDGSQAPGQALGIYTLTSDRIRHLPEEEAERKERVAEDGRSARYREIYEDLGLRVVARPEGSLEASWRRCYVDEMLV